MNTRATFVAPLFLSLLLPLNLLTPRLAAAQPCQNYLAPTSGGVVTSGKIDEASGLAASRRTPGVYWTHNDSGDAPRLFALDEAGQLLGIWTVPDADAIDWEDIAAGPCGVEECLYIGDVGNNAKRRDDQVIYRVVEPLITSLDVPDDPPEKSTQSADVMRIRYPYDEGVEDDNPDVEALMVDPRDGVIYLVTKESLRARLLRAGVFVEGGDVTLEHLGATPTRVVTSADWRPDGERFVVRTYASFYEYDVGDAAPGEIFEEPTRSERIRGEIQGEAIAYALDGASIRTLAEGDEQTFWSYACEETVADLDMGEARDMSAHDMAATITADMPADAGSSGEDMDAPDLSPGPDQSGEAGADAGALAAPDQGSAGNDSGSTGCSCGTLRAPTGRAPMGSSGVLLILLMWGRSRRRHVDPLSV